MPDWPLTREQILVLPAGAETDALVAERFLGWRVTSGPNYDRWLGAHGKVVAKRLGPESEYDSDTPAWSPTTNIQDALRVWEEMNRRGWQMNVMQWNYPRWLGVLAPFKPSVESHSIVLVETLPLLIARAALLTVVLSPQGAPSC